MAMARRAERDEARALRARGATGRAIGGTIGRSVAGTLSSVGSVAIGALGIGGSIAMGSAIKTQMDEGARASQLANQAGKPEIKGELLKQAQGVRGFTGMEALEGLGSFVDVTGDLQAGRDLLADMGDVALATSTSLADLGGAMGTAFIPLADAIKDPTERLKVLNNVMRATAGMGAVGAVEVKDLASEMSGLAATSTKFKGDPEKNLNMMVAFAQAARQRGGASSAAEAVTSVERFGSDVITKGGDLKKIGVDVFERDAAGVASQLKSPEQLMEEIIGATRGDLGKLSGIFGERSIRAIQGFSPLFTKAEAENAALPTDQRLKTGEAGKAAIRDEMSRLMKASVSSEQIGSRVASRMADPDMQFKEATKAFNAEIGAKLLPVLTTLIPEFTKLIPTMADAAKAVASFAKFMLENPLKGLGAIIAAKVAVDLAQAGIGAGVKGIFEKLALSMAGGGGGQGAVAALGGTVSAPAGGLGRAALAGGLLTITATSVLVAADQATELAEQSGGWEGVLAGIKGIISGEGYSAGVDKFQNQKAAERFNDPFGPEAIARRQRAQDAADAGLDNGAGTGRRTLDNGMSVVNGQGGKVDFDALPPEKRNELMGAPAAKLDAGATKLDAAATKLAEASAILSKIMPNRGNTPSDGNPTKT